MGSEALFLSPFEQYSDTCLGGRGAQCGSFGLSCMHTDVGLTFFFFFKPGVVRSDLVGVSGRLVVSCGNIFLSVSLAISGM